jgi:hypothetical protein
MSYNKVKATRVLIENCRKERGKELEEYVDETTHEISKKCAYKYCYLNDIKENEVFGTCRATNYRFNRCKKRVKTWLKDFVKKSVHNTIKLDDAKFKRGYRDD